MQMWRHISRNFIRTNKLTIKIELLSLNEKRIDRKITILCGKSIFFVGKEKIVSMKI